MTWTKVTPETLPPEGEAVMVTVVQKERAPYDKDNRDVGAKFVVFGMCKYGKWHLVYNLGRTMQRNHIMPAYKWYEVTHWSKVYNKPSLLTALINALDRDLRYYDAHEDIMPAPAEDEEDL